jgi:hypothetical protein
MRPATKQTHGFAVSSLDLKTKTKTRKFYACELNYVVVFRHRDNFAFNFVSRDESMYGGE